MKLLWVALHLFSLTFFGGVFGMYTSSIIYSIYMKNKIKNHIDKKYKLKVNIRDDAIICIVSLIFLILMTIKMIMTTNWRMIFPVITVFISGIFQVFVYIEYHEKTLKEIFKKEIPYFILTLISGFLIFLEIL